MTRRGTRERILKAALEVFAEKGYGGTTTREIASRANVNHVTPFPDGIERVLNADPDEMVNTCVASFVGGLAYSED